MPTWASVNSHKLLISWLDYRYDIFGDTDDVDSLPAWCSGWSKLKRGRCISKACRPASPRSGLTSARVNQRSALRGRGGNCSKVQRSRKRRREGECCPQSMRGDFFSSSLLTWLMQLQRTLGELINFKAGWVSKVNDLIIFPASLLRSQLSGSGKWGCGPLWCLRHMSVCTRVCVCVFAYLCFCVSLYIKKGKKIENERERAVAITVSYLAVLKMYFIASSHLL